MNETCGNPAADMTVAVVDDDPDIGNMLQQVLKQEGYRVLRAYSGSEALLLMERESPDLILLDLMLPGMSGSDILPRLCHIPTIVLSARSDPEEKVNLLMSGAVDYVTKPCYPREVLARIRLQLEHRARRKGSVLQFDMITLDPERRIVTVAGQPVHLTRTEYAILKVLMTNARLVISRDRMMAAIEEDTPDCEESSLKVHIAHLRNKLRQCGGQDYIEAVWGIGYKLKAPVAAGQPDASGLQGSEGQTESTAE